GRPGHAPSCGAPPRAGRPVEREEPVGAGAAPRDGTQGGGEQQEGRTHRDAPSTIRSVHARPAHRNPAPTRHSTPPTGPPRSTASGSAPKPDPSNAPRATAVILTALPALGALRMTAVA